MVRAVRLAVGAITAVVAVAALSGTATAASPAGYSSCPAARPASTGELHVTSSGDQTYDGFALESKAVLCLYAPAAVLDVTVVGGNGQVTVPGLGQLTIPPGVHYYVLVGTSPDGEQVAFTERIVGADLPPAAATPAAVPTPQTSSSATPLPTITVAATTPAVESESIVVKVNGANDNGNGNDNGDDNGNDNGEGQGSPLAKTGATLVLGAAKLGALLLLLGVTFVAVTRRRSAPL